VTDGAGAGALPAVAQVREKDTIAWKHILALFSAALYPTHLPVTFAKGLKMLETLRRFIFRNDAPLITVSANNCLTQVTQILTFGVGQSWELIDKIDFEPSGKETVPRLMRSSAPASAKPFGDAASRSSKHDFEKNRGNIPAVYLDHLPEPELLLSGTLVAEGGCSNELYERSFRLHLSLFTDGPGGLSRPISLR